MPESEQQDEFYASPYQTRNGQAESEKPCTRLKEFYKETKKAKKFETLRQHTSIYVDKTSICLYQLTSKNFENNYLA